MRGRIVEIARDEQYLSVYRGFLVVSHRGDERARVALDDIGALIGNAYGLIYSNNAIVELAERGVPTILCGRNHSPAAIVWPVDSHYQLASRIHSQVAASAPLRKRIWKQIVERKLLEQARLLELAGRPHRVVQRLASRVRSGDRGNLEARGARHYWRLLFGESFRRDRDAPGANALLNYGYAVLRATVARAVAAVGLHPAIGIHHRSGLNAFQLVDDLMESYRPAIDAAVWKMVSAGATEVSADAKRNLALLMYIDRRTSSGSTPLCRCVELTALSLVAVLEGKEDAVSFPELPATLEAASGVSEGLPYDADVRIPSDVDAGDV